jgi:hypothetical protein
MTGRVQVSGGASAIALSGSEGEGIGSWIGEGETAKYAEYVNGEGGVFLCLLPPANGSLLVCHDGARETVCFKSALARGGASI